MSRPAVLLACCLASITCAADEEKRPTAVPSESPEHMLQRFVDECVKIEPGKKQFPKSFVIGSEKPGPNELKRREVEIGHSFRISKYEMTQELYEVVTGRNPSRWKGPRNSVETISWQDATRFCGALTRVLHMRKLISEDEVVRLPTALEWEYCCRAGTKSSYSFGDDTGKVLDEHAWHTGNAAGNDPAVGVLKPNPWGLYDVHGYLWEFVSDAGDGNKSARIIRGGSWRDPHSLLSSASYLTLPDHAASDAIGFRCIIASKPEAKKPADQ